jgi:hypothetical protein
MAMYMELESGLDAAITTLILVNGNPGSNTTSYNTYHEEFDLGSPVEKPMYGRTIDSLGVRVTGATIDARECQIGLWVSASTVSALQTALDNLVVVCSEITHRGGGLFRYRSKTGSYITTYKVRFAQVGGLGAMHWYEGFLRQYVTLSLVVDPYGLSDPYDISDDFSTNTLGTGGKYNKGGADWTLSGSLTPVISGGILKTLSTTGQPLWTHTGTPHTHGDVQVTTKLRLDTTNAANKFGAVILRYINSTNYLYVRAIGDGAGAGTLAFISVVNGSATSVASTAITTFTPDTWYWLRARIEGNVVHGEFWTTEPTPSGTPTYSFTASVLTSTNALLFGAQTRGRCGILWNTQGSNTISFDDFKIQSCPYRAWSFPDVLPLNASWGGTTDAQAGVYFTNSSTAPVWMLYAWWPKPGPTNLVWNGGGEVIGTTTTVAYGWSAATRAGVHNAATSVQRVTTQAYEGSASVEIVTPGGAANEGADFAIYHRFKKGVTYIARLYARSSAATSGMDIRFGNGSGTDQATSSPLALATTWKAWTVTWTPTADRDIAYLTFMLDGTAAVTCQVDRVQVYEAGPLKNQYTSNTLDDPVTYFRLGESSGNVTDAIGARTGTVNGNPTYGNIGPIPGDSTTCIDFDGTGDYVSVAYNATDNPSVFTYECWAMIDAGAGTDRLVLCNRPAAATSGMIMWAGTGNFWQVRLHNGGGASAAVTSAVTATVGQWFHLAAEYDGTTLFFYIDGKLVGSSAGTFVANTTSAFIIGALADGSSAMNGKIANVRVYNRAIGPDAILRRAQGAPPTLADGAWGPGILNGNNYDAAKASLSSDGAYWTAAADANYRSGFRIRGTGSMTTTANLEYFIRPDLFAQDDFTQGEVDIEVYARCEVANTQTSLNCAISAAPEGGTSFGARVYSGFRSTGKTLKLPSSGTAFKPYRLGKITCRFDKANPIRWKLRLAFTNSVSATGNFGLDYLILVPAQSVRCSRTGAADSVVPDFIASTSQTTKLVTFDGKGVVYDQTTAGVSKQGGFPDDGLGGENILLDRNGAELLVWPSDQVVDLTDSSTHSQALAHTGTVQVAVQPQHHLLRQS